MLLQPCTISIETIRAWTNKLGRKKMQNLHERVRRWNEQMIVRSERAMVYWDKVPLHRMGDEMLDRFKAVALSIIDGEGDITTNAIDASFLLFLISQKGPEIREKIGRSKGADISETQVAERDLDREEWERKRQEKKGGSPSGAEDWRG